MALATVHEATEKSYARSEERERVCGKGEFTWDHGTEAKQSAVQVRNISDHGLQLHAPEYVRTGSAAYLTGSEFQCVGSIKYCVPNGEGFLVGLEFSQDPHFKNTLS